MKKVVNRDYSRTEADDFKLNVEDRLDKFQEVLPVKDPNNNVTVAWVIQYRYE